MNHVEVKFIAEASMRYHRRRAMFLDRFGSILNLLNMISGASAFVSIISEYSEITKLITIFIVIVNSIQFVFRIEQSATMHKVWLGQWHDVLCIVESKNELSQKDISEFVKIRNSIERDCVTDMHALKVDCFNKTAKALDLDTGNLKKLSWLHRIFMHIIPFENSFAD